MAIRIVPYTAEYAPAVRAFNQRMVGGGQGSLLLPDDAVTPPADDRVIRALYHLALEDDAVRGGFVICNYPASLNGAPITASDCISPISEGIVNPKYGMLAMHFVRYLQQQTPYGFAVGMGAVENAFPRLLRASGWTILTAPFFFRVFRAGRFFRELRLLRRSALRRAGSALAAATGLGSTAMAILQGRATEAHLASRGLTLETAANWDEAVDTIWAQFKESCGFTVARDATTLRDLYSPDDPRIVRFLVKRGGKPVAWAAALNTPMRGDQYFGDLQVATILDCVGSFEQLPAAIDLVSCKLSRLGADLVLSNQTHTALQAAFDQAGFLHGPSNYIVGISKGIADQVRGREIHITRGDGDGRMHL